jgi:hypothetical protein
MLRYRLDYFAMFLAACEMVSRDCIYLDGMGKPTMGTDEWAIAFAKMVKGLGIAVRQMDGDKSLLAQIETFHQDLERGIDRRPAVVRAGLRPLIRGVEEILQNRLFMFVPEDQAAYYMNVAHFGDAVAMFAEALGDMVEASNCYAAGRATACVFHSMRVAEHGLRFLAKELGVDVGTATKPLPVEYATWEAVLIKVEEKRKDLRTQPKNKQHEDKTIALADLASHCAHLKDLWRNPTMHSRGLYDMPEALGCMGRVAHFMKLVAASEYAPALDENKIALMNAVLNLSDGLRSRE